MKIAYLSQSALSDVDFSYIKEAQKTIDITYYILVSPTQRQKAAINLKSLPNRFGIISAVSIPELSLFGKIVDLSKVYVINYTSTNNHQISKIIESYKVYRELKDKKYDVIHLTWPPSYLDWFIYKLKKKIVLTVHDPFPHSSQAHSIRESERKKSIKRINHFILLNSKQKGDFLRAYDLEKPGKNVYDSLLSRYDYLYIHADKIKEVDYNQILFFGQIFSHKGVDYLLEAMEIVHERMPETKLIVAGSGKYWFDINKYTDCSYIDIQNRFIPDAELVSMISSSALVVVPYIDATQSGVIMSAYAFNRPCIATNVGALPEMVKDGINGKVIPPKDSKAIADAICQLLSNKANIDAFSRKIEDQYSKGELSWETIAKQHKHIYEQI